MKTLRGKMPVREMMRQAARDFPPRIEIAFLLQDWDDPYNVGGMFRVADACGAECMVLSGRTPQPPDPQLHVTSMGQHRRVDWRHFKRHDEAMASLREDGWSLVAVEIAEGAEPYQSFAFPPRTCLVLGNEAKGIYPGVLNQCESAVFIPMGGKGRSLNVHVSASVVAFHALFVGTSQSSE